MSPATNLDKDQGNSAQRLDIVARGLDLAAVTTRHTPVDVVGLVTEGAVRLGSDLLRWLAHERIAEGAFFLCHVSWLEPRSMQQQRPSRPR